MSRIACSVLFLLLVVSSVAGRAQSKPASGPSSASALARELAAARREGIPVSAKDMQTPLPPPDQNAAPIYAQLDRVLKAKPVRQEDNIAGQGMGVQFWPAPQMEQLRRALTNRKDIVDLIHRAASRPKCVYVYDWSKGPNFTAAQHLPQFSLLHHNALWLSDESALQLYDKKPLEAVRTQALDFRLAQHAASDPTLSAYLIGSAVDDIALGGMRRILYVAGDDSMIAATVQQAIERDRTAISVVYALRGEMGFNLLAMDWDRKAGPAGVKAQSADEDPSILWIPPFAFKDRKIFDRYMDNSETIALRTMRQALKAARQPYPQARIALSALDTEIQRRGKTDPAYICIALLSPLYSNAINKSATSEATAATVRCGAALLVWKAKHGAFPKTLAEAIHPVPADPFTGKPLSYRQEGSGFVVYSVGRTGKFDGGSPMVTPSPQESVFRYPLPAYINQPANVPAGMMGPPGMMGGSPPGR